MTCASHSCRDWKGNLRPQPIPQTHSCAPFKEKYCICISVYLYLCVFVYIPCWVGTILHPSLLPSSWQASVSEERSPTKSKPIATQPPAIVQKRVFTLKFWHLFSHFSWNVNGVDFIMFDGEKSDKKQGHWNPTPAMVENEVSLWIIGLLEVWGPSGLRLLLGALLAYWFFSSGCVTHAPHLICILTH